MITPTHSCYVQHADERTGQVNFIRQDCPGSGLEGRRVADADLPPGTREAWFCLACSYHTMFADDSTEATR